MSKNRKNINNNIKQSNMKKIALLMICAATIAACSTGKKQANETCSDSCHHKHSLTFNNADFYAADGTFNTEAAKDAVLQLMNYYKYPVTNQTRSQLWVSDYGTGRFTDVGLAAIMYANNTPDRYMLQDLFLLPNQMLPEHWHEKPEGDLPAKMEGWLVRNGLSYVVGEGEDNLSSFPTIHIPDCHTGGVTVKHVLETRPGQFVPLSRVLSHHWQLAGPEGAIITEVANVHVNEAVRHQVESINNHFLGK
jgi:D-lyxose ketol-isomerase